MQYTFFLPSGIDISRIGLGSWLTYGSRVSEKESLRCIKTAFDLGINVFDTAPNYGGGLSEVILGKALTNQDRSSYIIINKVLVSPGNESYDKVRCQVEASLKRMAIDYIDLLKIHHFDYTVDNSRLLDTIARLKIDGLVRGIGVSNWPISKIKEHHKSIDGIQNQYNLLWRYPERDVLSFAKSNNIYRFSWSSLAQGLLTGKYHLNSDKAMDSRANDPETAKYMKIWQGEEFQNTILRLISISEENSIELSHMALSWMLQTDNIDCALIGARSADQLKQCCSFIDDKLCGKLIREVDMASSF